jgi:hypothetical protein
VAYGLVLIWAFIGILIRQTSTLESRYPAIIAAVAVSLAVFAVAEFSLARRRDPATPAR